MKLLFLLLAFPFLVEANDNFISLVAGQQLGTQTTVLSTTVNSDSSNTKNHTNLLTSTQTTTTIPGQQTTNVGGVLYQRKINSTLVGILLQTNQTYSLTMGMEF